MNNSAETEALKKDMDKLKSDLSKLTDNVKQSAADQAQSGVDAARGKYNEYKREASRHADDWAGEIEARPFTSILVAFGAGLLLGKIFGR